jgi:hypothetical protein
MITTKFDGSATRSSFWSEFVDQAPEPEAGRRPARAAGEKSSPPSRRDDVFMKRFTGSGSCRLRRDAARALRAEL